MGIEERKCEAAGGIGRRRSRIEKRESFAIDRGVCWEVDVHGGRGKEK